MKDLKIKLINAIIEFSGDEFESIEDYKILATENITQLIERLINITEFYIHEYNN